MAVNMAVKSILSWLSVGGDGQESPLTGTLRPMI
jgi:hypothetical protein